MGARVVKGKDLTQGEEDQRVGWGGGGGGSPPLQPALGVDKRESKGNPIMLRPVTSMRKIVMVLGFL